MSHYPIFVPLSCTFLSFFVAKDAGILKKHGLDVDLVQLAGAVQTLAFSTAWPSSGPHL
jgi:ABC-type nitrate/sulfonate/bicarbonate transport system substrate-binding protein